MPELRGAEGFPMRGLRWAMAGAAAVALVAAAVAVGTAQAQTPPPPIAVEVLTRVAVFTDDVDLQIRDKLDSHATTVSEFPLSLADRG